VTNITLNEIPLFNGDQRPEGLAPSPAFKYHESNDHLILPDAIKAGENDTPHEMLLLDLYSALHALDEITGATTNDDILNVIFGKFCIGK